MKPDTDAPIVLRIYRLESGLWGGQLFAGEDALGELGAFQSAKEVERAAAETGLYPDRIEMEGDG